MGFSNVEYDLLGTINANLQTDVNSLNDSTLLNSRINTYSLEDQALALYLNRILLIVYVIIYGFVLFSLYLNRAKTSILTMVAITITFFALPFFIDTISKYMYHRFLDIMQLLYKGNSLYLYKPPEKIDTL